MLMTAAWQVCRQVASGYKPAIALHMMGLFWSMLLVMTNARDGCPAMLLQPCSSRQFPT